MRLFKLFFSTIFLFFSLLTFSININVSIFSDITISSFSVKIISGKYTVIDKTSKNKPIHLLKNDSLNFTVTDHHIWISARSKKNLSYDSLELKGSGINACFKLFMLKPTIKGVRTYEDNLELSVVRENLLVINSIELEKYIAGVVEAEGGNNSIGDDFYKVQSIICRSYAIKSIRKHIKDGFNLCDQIHCQVYRGKCKDIYNNIRLATFKTAGDVIVDENKEIISATYHSNSGGQTLNSEDIWNKPLSYLRSIKDTFSLNKPHSTWEKKISTQQWINYLSKNFNYPVTDTVMLDSALKFTQKDRLAFFPTHIPLNQIRTDFNLYSAFFSIIRNGDSLIFKGKGFGHGVGLSQEGAMCMAKLGYSYKDIIRFYYKNVNVLNFEEIKNINGNHKLR